MKKFKNYFIVILLFAASICLIFYLTNWYKTIKNYSTSETIMKDIISEIKPEDLNNYIVENQNTILYVTSGSMNSIKSFEKDFKKIIEKQNLRKEIVFIDIDATDSNNVIDVLSNNLESSLKDKNINLSITPNIYIIKDGKIIDLLYKVDTIINKNDTNTFLKLYEVIE